MKKQTTIKWDKESIRRERKKRNLTQTEMAEMMGCRPQTVSEWEVGDYIPRGAYQRLLTIMFWGSK